VWQWNGLDAFDNWASEAPAALRSAVLEAMAQLMENADVIPGDQYDDRRLVRAIDVPGFAVRIVFLRVERFHILVFQRVEERG